MRNPQSHEYFYYTKLERNALIFFALSSFFMLLGVELLPLILPQEKVDFSKFRKEIQPYSDANLKNKIAGADSFRGRRIFQNIELFYFDPNTSSKEDFTKLGLSPKIAQTILNYRSKGGHFYKKEDLKKIYGLRKEDYERLKNYIFFTDNQIADEPFSERQKVENEVVAILFPFDPNTATKEDFSKLGLAPKIAHTILNYRSKGGHFYKKEDLKKIYGLTEKEYSRLESSIKIEQKVREVDKPAIQKIKVSKPTEIDINKATAEEWQALRGIGPSYSKRIVKFRDELGGFAKIEQIPETFGLPDSVFQMIKPYLKISPVFRKLNVNTATLEELKAHPYISYNQARGIVNYRSQHGQFTDFEGFEKIGGALKEGDLKRLRPYFIFR